VTNTSPSEDKFEPSTVTSGTEEDVSIRKDIRLSEVAMLDRDDVVRCIEHRARDFQGWRPNLHIERLRTQRYGTGGYYTHHYDWSGGSGRTQNRVSTFNVYVLGECEGGGTQFPRISMPETGRGRWCEFLECKDDEEGEEGEEKMGVTFRPITGNAIFWENLGPDGNGYEETWHAGLPVLSGTKVGLNIWSWGPARRK
jgi:prolyl 4-hydroxylase